MNELEPYNPNYQGRGGATTLDGLAPTTAAKMVVRAIRAGWTQQDRSEVIADFLEIAKDKNRPVRDRASAARVLATLERNEIMAERNAIQEQGQETVAATERLRTLLANPEARQAMAALASASQVTKPVPETTPPQPEPEAPIRVEQGTDWASAGGD